MNQLALQQGGQDFRQHELVFSHLQGTIVLEGDSDDNDVLPNVAPTTDDVIYYEVPNKDPPRFDLQQTADVQIAGAVPVTDGDVATETVGIDDSPEDQDYSPDQDGPPDPPDNGDDTAWEYTHDEEQVEQEQALPPPRRSTGRAGALLSPPRRSEPPPRRSTGEAGALLSPPQKI